MVGFRVRLRLFLGSLYLKVIFRLTNILMVRTIATVKVKGKVEVRLEIWIGPSRISIL